MTDSERKHSSIPWPFLSKMFLLGLILILLAHVILAQWNRCEWVHLLGDVVRDLGIAFCVSVVIALSIEIGLTREVAANVLDAIMKRTVPKDVWDEMRDHIISQPVIREEFHLTMDMKNVRESEEGLSNTTLSYTLVSLEGAMSYNVQHELDEHRTPKTLKAGESRFQSVEVDKESYTGTKLAQCVHDLAVDLPVVFTRLKDRVSVKVTFKEVIKMPDVVTWWMSTITRNPTFEIANLPPDVLVRVEAHHPELGALTHTADTKWEFKGVMLPGQGVEFRFRKS